MTFPFRRVFHLHQNGFWKRYQKLIILEKMEEVEDVILKFLLV